MFKFEASYALHEGGTKYYQVFNIYNEISGDGVVVTHWGSYKNGAPREPRFHSKGVKIDVYRRKASISVSARVVREKTRRGYEHWDNLHETLSNFGEVDFHLREWFGTGDANLIIAHLSGHVDDTALSGLSADFIIIDELANIPTQQEIQAGIAKEKEIKMQNKNWGTW